MRTCRLAPARVPAVRATLVTAACVGVLVACEGDAPAADAGASAPAAAASGAPPHTTAPPAHPARFGLGRTPNAASLAAMDRDVGEPGAELPSGRGSVTDGRALYAAQCAMCHGVNGEGIAPAFPALSGRDPKAEDFAFASDPKLVHTIGNYWPYATTLFDYIRRAMPLTAPGSLSDDQVYALTAYLLAKDGILPDTTTLDAARLRAVRMPYRDRFVPDDRRPAAAAR